MKRLTGLALAGSMGFSAFALAQEPVGPKLTPRLKELIASEMQLVAKATQDLSIAIASGDHDTVKNLGIKVRDSFILKKSLTDQDKKDLMAAVSPQFVALDRRFHGLAGKLAHAAEAKDSEMQSVFYYKMLESCVGCHAYFAADRFPGLAQKTGEHKH